jgi:hypothetical protein
MATPNPMQFASTEDWSVYLAGQADFPDGRLNTRLALVLRSLADRPLDAFPQATGSASQAKGLYRFLSNERLQFDDFLQPLVDTTVEACGGLPTLLSIQDTSAASYPTLSQTTGLGKVNDSDVLGLHVHSTIAVEPNGVTRGLLHQSIWSRPPEDEPKNANHKQRPIEDKESYKWLEGIEAAEAAFEGLEPAERPRLLHIFDREGDIHEVLQRISASPHGAIIRAAQNRAVATDVDHPELNHAFDAVAAAPLIGVHVLEVPAKAGAKKRRAQLELRSVTLTITPSSQYPGRQPVTWTLVEARESNPPPGVEALHWFLWTTEPATTKAEIIEILRLYKLRWTIEDFHLTLKSGCKIEDLRLGTAERLSKAICLYSAVALRILAMRNLARQQPNASCEILLNRDQWHALYSYFHGKRPADHTKPPTIKEAVRWIARLGGHLNRKHDGNPGVRTLWRGWRDLAILVAGYRAAQETHA